MKADPIRGKTIQWTFTDGPMANRSFEHAFHADGTVEFWMLDGKRDERDNRDNRDKPTLVKKYEVATVGADVHAASYLGPSGYTLTVVLDFRSAKLVAFASNEKELSVQHGTFAILESAGAPRGEHAPSLR